MKDPYDAFAPTRASLLKRLKNLQDQESWQQFFDTYGKLIYGYARQRDLTDTEAQEVVQKTMICVADKMPAFEYNPAIGRFISWLLRTTYWRIIDQFRERGRFAARPSWAEEATAEEEANLAEPAAPELKASWDIEWEKNLLEAAMAKVRRRVNPQQYQLYDFYVNKEWPAEKVAAHFGVSVNQVHLAKHRIWKMIVDEGQRLDREML
jgi:RNA polymerase sigma-70 factor (ECF subfamily)